MASVLIIHAISPKAILMATIVNTTTNVPAISAIKSAYVQLLFLLAKLVVQCSTVTVAVAISQNAANLVRMQSLVSLMNLAFLWLVMPIVDALDPFLNQSSHGIGYY